MEQTFIKDIINTNEKTFLSALNILLIRNYLRNDLLGVVTLLCQYNLPSPNIDNLLDRYLTQEDFDISSCEMEE